MVLHRICFCKHWLPQHKNISEYDFAEGLLVDICKLGTLHRPTRNNKSFKHTPAEVKTEGNGTPLSPGPWESLPGPELSRSRRLEPSGLDWAMLEPSNRLLNSFGLEAEGFDRALSESKPKGGRLSRLIMERSEPDSVRRWYEDGNVTSTYALFLGTEITHT